MNKRIDREFLRPAAVAYVETVPTPVQDGVTNFADNVDLPGVVVNNLLQFDLASATKNTLRFAINTTVGVGGIFDPADVMGLYEESTDFGATLHAWGVPEGAYQELPVLGPSTERATVGRVVDLFTNPLTNVLGSPEKYAGTTARVIDKVGQRGRFRDTVDSVLYDSADSYSQSRLIYLQGRRFEVGDRSEETDIDPFVLDTEGF